MTEKMTINGKDVWIHIEPHLTPRENPHIIPTEYFMATWYDREPDGKTAGEVFIDGNETKMFESPVAALEYAREKLSLLL